MTELLCQPKLLFTFNKDIQPGDRTPFRFRHTLAAMPIPALSPPANLGHPSKTDDAASEVDAILYGAELARQGAVEEQ
mgnify:CR=1 FL=1